MAGNPGPQSRFSLISVLRKPNVHPNGSIHIDLYFSGVGYPCPNKFQMILPDQSIINGENIGTVRSGYGYKPDDQNDTGQVVGVNQAEEKIDTDLSSVGITTNLPKWFFANIPPEITDGGSDIEYPSDFQMNVSEVKIDTDFGKVSADNADNTSLGELGPAPLQIVLNLDDATPGDYQIETTFTYHDGITLCADRETISFHVTSWPERHRVLVAIGSILSGLAIIGVMIQVIGMLAI